LDGPESVTDCNCACCLHHQLHHEPEHISLTHDIHVSQVTGSGLKLQSKGQHTEKVYSRQNHWSCRDATSCRVEVRIRTAWSCIELPVWILYFALFVSFVSSLFLSPTVDCPLRPTQQLTRARPHAPPVCERFEMRIRAVCACIDLLSFSQYLPSLHSFVS
jgi:hypothetical protein